MAEPISIQQLKNASLDVKSLEEVVNGDENVVVTTRLGETYPSVKGSINKLFENGGLPATPFETEALMTASSLADRQYAVVTDDTNIEKVGLYVKVSGSWIYSAYNTSPSNDLIFFKAYSSTTISYNPITRVLSTSGSIVINTKANRIKGRNSLVIPAFSVTLQTGSYSVAYIDLNSITASGDIDPNVVVKVGRYQDKLTDPNAYVASGNQVAIFSRQGDLAKSENGFFDGHIAGVYTLNQVATNTAVSSLASKVSNINENSLPIFFKAYTSSTIDYDSSTRTLSTSNLTVVNLPSSTIKGRASLLIPAFSVVLPASSYGVAYIDLTAIPDDPSTEIDPTTLIKAGRYQEKDANAYKSTPNQIPIFVRMYTETYSVNGFFDGQISGVKRSLNEQELFDKYTLMQGNITTLDSRILSLENGSGGSSSSAESATNNIALSSGKLVEYTTDGLVEYYNPAPNAFLGGVTQNAKNVVGTLDKKALTNITPSFIGGKNSFVKSPIVIPSDPNILIVIPSFGQSNSVGSEGYEPPINLTINEYGDSLMMPAGVGSMDVRMNLPSGTESVGAETVLDAATITGFQPLIAKQSVARANQGATPLEAMGLVLAKNIHQSMGVKPKICMFAAGWGGRLQSALAKGTIPYQNLLTALTKIKTLAEAEGWRVYVPFVTIIHGESDAYRAAYLDGIKSWQVDFDADIRAVTGQEASIPFLCSQASVYTGANVSGVLAPYIASQTGNTHYVAAPYYPYVFAPDNLHLGKSAGYVGEKLAHAASRISGLFGAKDKGALQPTSVNYNGANEVTVNFNVPVSPMVRDTTYTNVNTPAPADWGFRIRDGSGETVAIKSIQIVGDAVKITTGTTIASGTFRSVDYALTGFGKTKVYGEQPRGQLRDSEKLASIIDGKPLYNWCVHFRELF